VPYLTSETIPAAKCRRLLIPDDLDIIASVTGALHELCKAQNWEQFGAVTIGEIVQAMIAMLGTFEECQSMIGVVVPVTLAELPDWMLLCDGTIYDRVDYPELYDVLHPAYRLGSELGFRVPDLRRQTIVGAEPDGYDVGLFKGHEEIALTVAQLPSHAHSYTILSTAQPLLFGEVPAGFVFQTQVAVNTGAVGGNEAHPNLQPSLCMDYAIIAR
jgi:microcystin-dependent protein